ncbi:MAG: hypothetical protein JNJ49_06615 [Bdellovibrionaceae bacterium]|nr:hypothetical protein [Pseudobdellovibrionaceae bacterium]
MKRSLIVGLCFFAMQVNAAGINRPAAKPEQLVVASSVVTDAGAKKIRRTMASENLKTLSTREQVEVTDVTAADVSHDGHEHAVAPSRTVVVTHDAPGTAAERAPAAQAEHSHSPAPAAAHHAATPGVSAEQALKWLQNGNKRYLSRANRTDGKSQKDRERLGKGQHPHAIVLSCADSRVPPETVFDQALGEVFVVRTAGESLDSSVIASLEYAVEHLGPRLLVVMGHTSCGAVKAALETPEDKSAGSPSLDKLVGDIRPRIPNRTPAAAPSAGLEIESAANAQGVAADLLKRSEIIRARVEKGDLLIKPALYYLDSGSVKFY